MVRGAVCWRPLTLPPVNEVICHGIPDQRPLRDGDIVNVDVTAFFEGAHGDLNETFLVGAVDEEGRKLVAAAYGSLMEAIAMVKPGAAFRDLGSAIEPYCKARGFSVVKSYCGHGIGTDFHSEPSIPHYARNKAAGVMAAGQVFTIEPMVNAGTYHDKTWPDQWTSVTKDGKRSAQFEHTMLVTDDGVEILTARSFGSYLEPVPSAEARASDPKAAAAAAAAGL